MNTKQSGAAPIALSRVEISTSAYQFAHGKEPRGRGSWAFFFSNASEEPWWAPGSLLYSEACQKARAEAQRRGVTRVIVAT
jgi:hypothetical protein